MPLMFVTLALSHPPPGGDFYAIEPDSWLVAYRAVFALTIIYLLSMTWWVLLIVRDDPAKRRTADLQLLGCACGFGTCVLRLATAAQYPVAPGVEWAASALLGLCMAYYCLSVGVAWRSRLCAMRAPLLLRVAR